MGMQTALLEEIELLGWYVDFEVEFGVFDNEYSITGLKMLHPSGDFINFNWFLDEEVKDDIEQRLRDLSAIEDDY